MDLKNISKQLPANIPGHRGQLTIMKRNAETYYCLYPEATDLIVPVIKGKSIEYVIKKMHKTLIKKGIIKIDKKRRVKISKGIKKPKTKKQLRQYKLTRQKNLLKNK